MLATITQTDSLMTTAMNYQHVQNWIGGWIVLVIILFAALVVRYTFGYGFSKDKPNPYQKETFAMPRGIFRGILTLSLLFTVLVLETVSVQGEGVIMTTKDKDGVVTSEMVYPEDSYAELIVAFQMMLAFYFGSKVAHHVTNASKLRKDGTPPPTESKGAGNSDSDSETEGIVG